MSAPDLLLLNPNTKLASFGTVSGTGIPSGMIYPKAGKHLGPNRGFGAAHIYMQSTLKKCSHLALMELNKSPILSQQLFNLGRVFIMKTRAYGATYVSLLFIRQLVPQFLNTVEHEATQAILL
jgi:hypothetical protein